MFVFAQEASMTQVLTITYYFHRDTSQFYRFSPASGISPPGALKKDVGLSGPRRESLCAGNTVANLFVAINQIVFLLNSRKKSRGVFLVEGMSCQLVDQSEAHTHFPASP